MKWLGISWKQNKKNQKRDYGVRQKSLQHTSEKHMERPIRIGLNEERAAKYLEAN